MNPEIPEGGEGEYQKMATNTSKRKSKTRQPVRFADEEPGYAEKQKALEDSKRFDLSEGGGDPELTAPSVVYARSEAVPNNVGHVKGVRLAAMIDIIWIGLGFLMSFSTVFESYQQHSTRFGLHFAQMMVWGIQLAFACRAYIVATSKTLTEIFLFFGCYRSYRLIVMWIYIGIAVIVAMFGAGLCILNFRDEELFYYGVALILGASLIPIPSYIICCTQPQLDANLETIKKQIQHPESDPSRIIQKKLSGLHIGSAPNLASAL